MSGSELFLFEVVNAASVTNAILQTVCNTGIP